MFSTEELTIAAMRQGHDDMMMFLNVAVAMTCLAFCWTLGIVAFKGWLKSHTSTAVKFHKLALLESSYAPEAQATAGLSVYRCKPIKLTDGGLWDVKLLERHPATNQAFIPMGGSPVGEAIATPGERYLVIVAPTDAHGKPDLNGLRAFVASAAQGVLYNTGTWRKS